MDFYYYFCVKQFSVNMLVKLTVMTVATKNIIDTYSSLFEGLDSFTKLELIERLSRSLKKEKNNKEKAFFKSFGAFPEGKSAEEITGEIKASRSFRDKDLKF